MSNGSTCVLAVDGGGTKCLAILADREHGVVGSGRSGGCNPQSVGRERAAHALTEAIRAACRGLPEGVALEAAAFGMAGVDTPRGEEEARLLAREALQRANRTARQVLVENDGLTALRGAAAGGRGLLVAAGTGSVAYAGDGERFVRAGGWGHHVGDVGSAYQIAHAALEAAFRQGDGYPLVTDLPRYLCAAVGVADLHALHDWLYQPGAGVEVIAALARAVDRAACEGDPAAIHILQAAGSDLAQLATVAAQRAGLVNGSRFPVFLLGGVLQNSRVVREALLHGLAAAAPGAVPEVPRYAPIFGAVIRALGGPSAVGSDLRQQLLQSQALLA